MYGLASLFWGYFIIIIACRVGRSLGSGSDLIYVKDSAMRETFLFARVPDSLFFMGKGCEMPSFLREEMLRVYYEEVSSSRGRFFALLRRYYRWKEVGRYALSEAGLHEDLLFLAISSGMDPSFHQAERLGFWALDTSWFSPFPLHRDSIYDMRYDIVEGARVLASRLSSWEAADCGGMGVWLSSHFSSFDSDKKGSQWKKKRQEQTFLASLLVWRSLLEHPKQWRFSRARFLYLPSSLSLSRTEITRPIEDLEAWARGQGMTMYAFMEYNPMLQDAFGGLDVPSQSLWLYVDSVGADF